MSTIAESEQKTLINYRTDAGVSILEISDPPANTYTYEMNRQLDEAILRARMDKDVYVIVLIGAGSANVLESVRPQAGLSKAVGEGSLEN